MLRRTHTLAATAFLFASAFPALASAQIFKETWENGGGAWTNNPPLMSDGAATKTFQRETVNTGGGRVATVQAIGVQAGNSYCMTAWVRGTANAGTSPFIGIQTNRGEHWLMGGTVFPDGYGGEVTPIVSDGNWHWYTRKFTLNGDENSLQIKDEKFQGDPNATADFDDIELYADACPAAPRNVPGDNTFCAGNTPLTDMAVNACVACAVDNGQAGLACVAATPYCAANGSCGTCALDADCAGHAGGAFCTVASGACTNVCANDAQCGAGKFCDRAGIGGGACTTIPVVVDAGVDSGVDGGFSDGGAIDSGVRDSGAQDASVADAATQDASIATDAGKADAGHDSGTADSGTAEDAGTPVETGEDVGGGCSCDVVAPTGTSGAGLLVAAVVAVGSRLRRKRA